MKRKINNKLKEEIKEELKELNFNIESNGIIYWFEAIK